MTTYIILPSSDVVRLLGETPNTPPPTSCAGPEFHPLKGVQSLTSFAWVEGKKFFSKNRILRYHNTNTKNFYNQVIKQSSSIDFRAVALFFRRKEKTQNREELLPAKGQTVEIRFTGVRKMDFRNSPQTVEDD